MKKQLSHPNYTQIPNSILGDIIKGNKVSPGLMATLEGSELKVLLAVCRLTFGYHREERRASLTDIQKMTGLSRQGVIDAANSLEQKYMLIERDASNGVTLWRVVVNSVDQDEEVVNSVDQSSTKVVNSVDQSSQLSRPPSKKETLKENKERKPSSSKNSDYLTDVLSLQGQTSEHTGSNPEDQWLNYRDTALKAFKGDLGRTPDEREARRNAILGFVADTPDFDPVHWETIINDAITHGVGANNIARFIEAYPFESYDAYLTHKYPSNKRGNGKDPVTERQPAIRTEDGGYYV